VVALLVVGALLKQNRPLSEREATATIQVK